MNIVSMLIFLYVGFGAGYNYQLFKDGAKLYFREEGKQNVEIKDIHFTLFIAGMVIAWPLYFSMSFRKKFMILGRWQ